MYTLYTFLLVVMLIAITDGFDPFYKIVDYVKLELKYAIIRARLNLINVQVSDTSDTKSKNYVNINASYDFKKQRNQRDYRVKDVYDRTR